MIQFGLMDNLTYCYSTVKIGEHLYAPAKNYTVANKNNISKRKKLKKSKLIL